MTKIVEEGSARIEVSEEGKISKKLSIFYNPKMKFNRDTSILLLNSVEDEDMQVALPLSGSGIRGLRFLKELEDGKIKILYMNDKSDEFYDVVKENFELNDISDREIVVSNEDANLFMLNNKGFDYIDIDPFGSPNPFLDAAVTRLARGGILAVTATDTAPLCGTYKEACKRKYWANPLNNELKHEAGLRILIRKVQLIGSQFEKALIPIFSFSRDHYFRVFFRCYKSKTRVDEVIDQHGLLEGAGPMWLGDLWDKKLVEDMYNNCSEANKKFLKLILEESKIKTVGFFDIHQICEDEKLSPPKTENVMEKVREKGFEVSRTHFSGYGIKSDITREDILNFIKDLQ